MPRSAARRAPARRTAPRGGFGWFLLLVIGGGALAGYIFAGDAIRSFLSPAPGEPPEGQAPVIAQADETEVESRDMVDLESRGYDGDAADLAKAAEETSEEPELETDRPAEPIGFADEDRGRQVLAQAEGAFRSYDWKDATAYAGKIIGMDVPPEVEGRARRILEYADDLKSLFARLESKDELMRNLETHPSLLVARMRGKDIHFVPLTDLRSKTIIDAEDPVAAFQQQLAAGEAAIMDVKRIAATVKGGDVTDVRKADVDELVEEQRTAFERRLARFKKGDMTHDPLAWYEAAKHAYQNRLDDHVVELLIEALSRDPELASTIREDKAADFYAKMVLKMENGDRAGAAGYMAQLRKHYEDTAEFKKAEAHYNGNLAKLRQVREEQVAARRRRAEEARKARIEAAKKENDQEKIAAIEKEREQEEQEARVPAAAANGDVAQADQWFAQGREVYAKASGARPTPQRDQWYSQAEQFFNKALAVYAREVEKGNGELESRMISCNKLRYACRKMRRF